MGNETVRWTGNVRPVSTAKEKKVLQVWQRMEQLTPRQAAVMRIISRHSHGCSPSLRVIGGRLGISRQAVHHIVDALVAKGVLSREPRKQGTLVPTVKVP